MALSGFVTSTMGMHSQSHALEQISANVANVNTVGYKKVDTRFETQMTKFNEVGTDSHYFSSGVVDRRMIDVAGLLTETNSIYDLGISGQGFFIVEGQHETLYSRAGNFQGTATTPAGYPPQQIEYFKPTESGVVTQSAPASYFTNGSGHYVMGWNYNDANGEFSSSLEPVIISPMEYYPGKQTTEMAFKGNIDATATDTQLLKFPVYDSKFKQHNMMMKWEPQDDANTWLVSVEIDGAAVGTAPTKVTFNEDGKLTSPIPSTDIQVTWDNGLSNNINLNFEHFTQYAHHLNGEVFHQNGSGFGTLTNTAWDEKGVLNAHYSNGETVPVCKVALAKVTVPNMMEAVSGNMFAYNQYAGDMEIVDLEETRTETTIQGGFVEQSNVALEEELSAMIVTQRAYSSNVKSFTTVNEMTQEAIGIMS